MKTFYKTWNHLKDLPNINDKIMLSFGNGLGTNKNKPYLVEISELEIRAGRKVIKVEGRQILKSGKLKNVWFELFFTDKLFNESENA